MAKPDVRELPSNSEVMLLFSDGSIGKCIRTTIKVIKESGTFYKFYFEPTEKTRIMLDIEDLWVEDIRYDRYLGCLVTEINQDHLIPLNPHNLLFTKYLVLTDWAGNYLDPTQSKIDLMSQQIKNLSDRAIAYSKALNSANRKMKVMSKFPEKNLEENFKLFTDFASTMNPLINQKAKDEVKK